MSDAASSGSSSAELDDDPTLDLTDALLRYVVSLYHQPYGKSPEHVGTAVLLRAHDREFLVSAAHVLREPNGLFFYIEQKTSRKLRGKLIRSRTREGETVDRIDVATLMLEGPGLPPYPGVEKESGDAALLVGEASALLDDDIYLVTGMPASRSKANPHTSLIKVEAFSLASPRAPASTYKSLNLDADQHLAIVLDRANSQNLDGSPRVFPDPHGMSGSPVWRLPSEANGLELPQLVAILTEYHKGENALVATRVREVARQMARLVK